MYIRLSVKKISSEGWFIQSWPSPKAVAIGCTRMTSSGAVEGCQLPTRGQSPGRRCLGDAFISQRYCDPHRTSRPPTPSLHTLPSHLFVFWGSIEASADPLVVICRRSPPCTRSSSYLFATGRASNHVMWARRPRSTYRLCSLDSSVLEGRWTRAADAPRRSKSTVARSSHVRRPPFRRRRYPLAPLGHHLPPVGIRRIPRS